MAIVGSGNHTSAAISTIDQPSAQITPAVHGMTSNVKYQPTETTVNSSSTSQRPRVRKKRLISGTVRPRASERKAPNPARRKKTGAQKCVIHRVKNSAGVVWTRSTGSNRAELKNDLVWSSAMSIIASPRRQSTDTSRSRADGVACDNRPDSILRRCARAGTLMIALRLLRGRSA
jgi:hypothetical protein